MKIELKEYQIDINNLSTGVYFINIFNEGKHILNKKIIIAR